jgi:class 3 adenylate cyclase/tetratricopeptide (TPR) repeat protein
MRCANCSAEVPENARFCPQCGTPVTPRAVPREERRIVSVVFVDLVGFTARSHAADPEDVRAALLPFHELVRHEVEHYGGTVDKFIGDGVLAVFGAPTAHEDDAERAVRAALAIVRGVAEPDDPSLHLSVRVGVNTGEAVVTLDPGWSGERILGDVVNTASRLQNVAPVGAVVVGELTHRFTERVISYTELEPVSVKGKPHPLRLWRADAARSRMGARGALSRDTPFVGRATELALLEGVMRRSFDTPAPHLVTIIGEPGVGKTRLLAELAASVDRSEDLINWRQGHSLPYGEGVTFWALGEIVKAQAGILESDNREQAGAKLRASVADLIADEDEREWFEERLGRLVGARTQGERATADPGESFAAWTRYLEAIATTRPTILVFEDIHWADEALLELIDRLLEWAGAVPLLGVGTARPELFERAPDWGGGKRNATTLALPPLSDAETAQLIAALLDQALLPAEVQSLILDRSGGNPLHAEEFVRMLIDRGVLRRSGRTFEVGNIEDIRLPFTIQALIAARLDILPAREKEVLQVASAAGRTFWAGAVASVTGMREEETEEALRALVKREMVRRIRDSSIADQLEYGFRHTMIKDVCYARIARRERVRYHRGLARWIEHIAGDRIADHAEFLAHHYRLALENARSSGRTDEVAELETAASRALVLAADRAASLDARKAEAHYSQALRLLPSGSPERARVLLDAGLNSFYMGFFAQAREHLEEAVKEYREQGLPRGQGEALSTLAYVSAEAGEGGAAAPLFGEAVALLEGEGPSRELCTAYARGAWNHVASGAFPEALEWAERAVAIARELDSKPDLCRALGARGDARCELGDPGGMDDIRERLRLAIEIENPAEIAGTHINLGDWVWWTEGPEKGLEHKRAAIDLAQRRGLSTRAMWARAESVWTLFELGQWDRVVAEADAVTAWDREHGGSQIEALALPYKVRVLWNRESLADAPDLEHRMVALALEMLDLQLLVPALATAALIRSSYGEQDAALALVEELEEHTTGLPAWRARHLPDVVRVLCGAGRVDYAERLLVEEGDVWMTRDRHSAHSARAALLEAKGNIDAAEALYREAVERWTRFGCALERGLALFGHGRCLELLGDGSAARARLSEARAVFEALGARLLLRRVHGFLDERTALSS